LLKLFFSYSHNDETFRDELEIHLSLLKRQGIIDTWHDRRILAGNEFEGEISENLENADIVLILVSHYFIGSDYCYDIEMKRALERHKKRETHLIPIILQPCDWKNAPFGKLLALPKDGKPISKYSNPNDAFLEIVEAIRRIAKQVLSKKTDKQFKQIKNKVENKGHVIPEIRSSNLRIVKEFSDKVKDDFLDASFEYISNFFENSLNELEKRNDRVETNFKRIKSTHFTAIIYINGESRSQCKIWQGGHSTIVGGIAYSTEITSIDNSYNEMLSVSDDGYSLFLKPFGLAFSNKIGQKENLSKQGAAEYLWSIFINPLQNS
jgi:hypothetical protein